jgi:hypothetical protein
MVVSVEGILKKAIPHVPIAPPPPRSNTNVLASVHGEGKNCNLGRDFEFFVVVGLFGFLPPSRITGW